MYTLKSLTSIVVNHVSFRNKDFVLIDDYLFEVDLIVFEKHINIENIRTWINNLCDGINYSEEHGVKDVVYLVDFNIEELLFIDNFDLLELADLLKK